MSGRLPAALSRRGALAGLAATLAQTAGAQETKAPPGFALVIGNGDYNGDAGVDGSEAARREAMTKGFAGDLPNATRDAELVARTLRGRGFDVTLATNCDSGRMFGLVQALRARAEAASETPRLIVYFAGHGVQISGRNYLVPVRAQLIDGDLNAMEDVEGAVRARCLAVQQLLISGGRSEAPGYSLLMLDACRDNPWEWLFKARAEANGRTYTERGLSLMAALSRRMIVSYATSPGGVASDGTGLNGPYAAALSRVLRGDLSIDIALSQIQGEVFTATNGAQTPWVSGRLMDGTRF